MCSERTPKTCRVIKIPELHNTGSGTVDVYFNWKKGEAEAHRILVNVYGESVPTDKSCNHSGFDTSKVVILKIRNFGNLGLWLLSTVRLKSTSQSRLGLFRMLSGCRLLCRLGEYRVFVALIIIINNWRSHWCEMLSTTTLRVSREITWKQPEKIARHDKVILQHACYQLHVAVTAINYMKMLKSVFLSHSPYSPELSRTTW